MKELLLYLGRFREIENRTVMEEILVESTKGYDHGFILKEQDLRRIIGLINEQLLKVNGSKPELGFTVKFENGAVASTPDVETLLNLDNEGSGSIVRLDIESKLSDKQAIIKMGFGLNDYLFENSATVRYAIKGNSRDWVFITSSLLEERIAKIKRSNWLKSEDDSLQFLAAFPVFIVVFILSAGLSFKGSKTSEIAIIQRVENMWKAHEISDPVDAVIQIEKGLARNREESGNFLLVGFLKPILITAGLAMTYFAVRKVYKKYYPLYVFYWGGGIEVFDKKESKRKLIIGFIVGTLLFGVIVNILSSFIWESFKTLLN